MPRYAPVPPESMTEAQARVRDAIAAGPRGSVHGPFTVLLHSPGAADRVQSLGAYIRFESPLPDRLRELAILVTARFWRAEYEWFAHEKLARAAGLPDAVIEAVRIGAPPPFDDPAEEAVHAFCAALHRDRGVDDAVHDRVLSLLGREALTDLVAVSGYYTLISMTLNVYGVPVPDGSRPFSDAAGGPGAEG